MPALHDIVTKGSTDRSVVVHIMDSTDGTPETAVVFNTSGIDMWYRREGAARVAVTEATLAELTTAHADGGFLHISDGDYRLDLPDAAFATGANYVDFGGTVTGMIVIGGRVRLINTSLEVANLTANVIEWHGSDLLTGTGPLAGLGVLDRGTAQSDSTTTLQLRSAAAFANDELIGATALLYSATTGAGQRSLITDYVGSTDTATIDTLVTDPTGTVRYEIYGTAASSGGAGLDAAGVRAAIGMSSANLDTQLSNIDNFVDTEITSLQSTLTALDGRIPAALVSGRMDSSVGAMAANALTAAATATDFTTEVTSGLATAAGVTSATSGLATAAGLTSATSGLATAANLATVAGYLDTEVSAIKAKTDLLTFTVAGQVDANTESMNAAPVLGDGSAGDKWRGA